MCEWWHEHDGRQRRWGNTFRNVKFMCIRKRNIMFIQTICFSRRWNNKCDINQWLIKWTRKTTTIIIILISFYCIIISDSSAINFPCRFYYPPIAKMKRAIISKSKTSLSWLYSHYCVFRDILYRQNGFYRSIRDTQTREESRSIRVVWYRYYCISRTSSFDDTSHTK